MKLTNQDVALVAILLAAIILSHVYAPTAAAAVVSIASTLIGAFFVNRNRGAKPMPPEQVGTPTLTLVKNEQKEEEPQ